MTHEFWTDSTGNRWRYESPALNAGYYGLADTGVLIRPGYAVHHRTIDNGPQFLSTLRAGEYAWPGGYRLEFVTSDGETITFDEARENLHQIIYSIRHGINDGWQVIACDFADEEEV